MGVTTLRQVLERVAEVAAAGELPIVVFDLDSTLFMARSRNLRIIRDFAAQSGKYPALASFASGLTVADLGYEVDHPLVVSGLLTDDMQADLRAFWAERFFTDEYCEHDYPLDGAVDFVRSVHRGGAVVYYLTGRHVGGMEHGTVRALTARGFPLFRGRTVLHLKPDFETPDGAFKEQAVSDIRSYGGSVVATFENEPGHADTLRRAFPDAGHFLLETVRSPTAPEPHPDLVPIPDFRLS